MRQRELLMLFDYMYWAHRRILETAAKRTDAQFTLPSVIAGRDLRATLVHTLDVEMSWRGRLQRRPEDEWRKALPVSDYRRVIHVVTDSHQHRSESAQLLTQLGRWPGDLDFLAYADSLRASVS